MHRFLSKIALLAIFIVATKCEEKKNILLILTDDQDFVLNGLDPMEKTRKWLQQQGQTFVNAFVSTPICCPSRSSILTGRYQHNTHVYNNTRSGNCYGDEWTSSHGLESRSTFAVILQQEAGYETFYAGKYLNNYHGKAIPKGWDHWHGLIGNSKYYNYTLNNNGVLERHGDDPEDYLTDLIKKKAVDFITDYSNQNPLLMVLAPPAPHAPFTPARRHKNAFNHCRAPRLPSFNYVENSSEAKHWLVQRQPRPLNASLIEQVDDVFRNRWRTLLAVDELVDSVLQILDDRGMLEKTVVIFTSDHGYHLGNYGLPLDKRMPYDTDIRVPLLIRGPGFEAGGEEKSAAVITLDIAPTLIEIGGLNHLHYGMDGISLLKTNYSRNGFLIEYHGEGGQGNDERCQDHEDLDQLSECSWQWACKCQDSKNNTYTCLRSLGQTEDILFCQFADDMNSQEFYDLKRDPYQLHNQPFHSDPIWEQSLQSLKNCKGSTSCSLLL